MYLSLENKKSGISSVNFSRGDDNILLTSTWDGFVNIFNISENKIINKKKFDDPLTCSSWLTDKLFVVGSIKGFVYFTDENDKIKCHNKPVVSVGYNSRNNLVFSAGLDGTVNLINKDDRTVVNTINFNCKITASSCSDSIIVIATNKGISYVIKFDQSMEFEKRVTAIPTQIRSVAIFPDSTGWAVGSIDGRVGIEYIGDIRTQAQRFSFHSHRFPDGDNIIVYPINCLAFHPQSGTLVSACSFGVVKFWDIVNKSHFKPLGFQFQTSIVSISFSSDGKYMAIAASYNWDKGYIQDMPDDELFIYEILEENISSHKE